MAKIVLVAAQKGGAGKTTLAVMLANSLHYRAGVAVAAVDADFQESLYKLRQGDLEDQPEADASKWYSVRSTRREPGLIPLLEELAASHEVIIIDTPGQLESGQVEELAALADLVVVPYPLALLDQQSNLELIAQLEDAYPQLPIWAVINKWKPRAQEAELLPEGLGILGHLPERAALGRLTTTKDVSRAKAFHAWDGIFANFCKTLGL